LPADWQAASEQTFSLDLPRVVLLKFLQNTIFRDDIFLSPMQDHKRLRKF